MKVAIALLVLLSSALSQVAHPTKTVTDGLRIELRTGSSRVHMKDDMDVSVFFRSDTEVTIWNALGWGAPAGLFLTVFDSSGHEVHNNFAPFFHPLPPDLTGKDALISIGGTVFAGFDSRISANELFPRPGKYTLACFYNPPLSRNYFRGHTIWGKEDGPIQSASVPVTVGE
jgi:hypothetical protein